MPITELADADGHIIEPGDLWVERLPKRPARHGAALLPRRRGRLSPAHLRHRHREPRGHVRRHPAERHAAEHGARVPRWACRSSASSPSDERERFTILDAPELVDGRPRAPRVQHSEQGVGRAVLFPTFMLPGGTFLPHLAPAVCQVYNDWIARRLLRRLGRPADPGRRAADRSTSRPPSPRCGAPPSAGFPAVVHPHEPGARQEVLRSAASTRLAGDRRHRLEARPAPAADVGPGRHLEGLPPAATSWRRRASAFRWT